MQRAQQYYRQFIADNQSSDLEAELAMAHWRLGVATLEIDSPAKARESLTAAIDMLNKLLDR